MKKTNPLVSIITIALNSSSTIKDAIESIIDQSYNHIEYIIIDGKSSDNTLEIIEYYSSKIKEKGIILKVVCEKDSGIADAWNKGLKQAKGSVIGFLNSDDWYDKFAIENVVKCIDPDKDQISYGVCQRVNKNKETIEIMNGTFNANRVYLNFGFSHTTCFITKNLWNKIGFFDPSFRIATDVDFLLRCCKENIPFMPCNNITYMRLGGISTKFEHEALSEYQKALRKNGYNMILIWVFGIIKKSILFLKNKRY